MWLHEPDKNLVMCEDAVGSPCFDHVDLRPCRVHLLCLLLYSAIIRHALLQAGDGLLDGGLEVGWDGGGFDGFA